MHSQLLSDYDFVDSAVIKPAAFSLTTPYSSFKCSFSDQLLSSTEADLMLVKYATLSYDKTPNAIPAGLITGMVDVISTELAFNRSIVTIPAPSYQYFYDGAISSQASLGASYVAPNQLFKINGRNLFQTFTFSISDPLGSGTGIIGSIEIHVEFYKLKSKK